MNSTTNTIADNLATAIASTFDVAATRCYSNNVRLDELNELKIYLIPRGRETEIESRLALQKTHKIEIGFQKHLSSLTDLSEADGLSALVENITDWLIGYSIGGATCIECKNILADDSLWAKEHWDSDNVFTSVLVASFLDVSERTVYTPPIQAIQ